MRIAHIGILTLVLGTVLSGQLNVLTVREAESIAEKIPAVAAAIKAGECPQFTATFAEQSELWLQVRLACGQAAGTLLNNYSVNRKTGMATAWGGSREPLLDSQGRIFAEGLAREAAARILSTSEGRCLALAGARAIPGWQGTGAIVSVAPLGQLQGDHMYFTALNQSSSRAVQTTRLLSLDLGTARVRDDETGLDLGSSGLGALTSEIIELRAPRLLTDEEALSIAMLIPAVASRVPKGCRLTGGGAFGPFDVVAGSSCTVQGHERTFAIDLRTGRVMDADSRRALESVDAAKLARQLLEAHEKRRTDLRKDLQGNCAEQ